MRILPPGAGRDAAVLLETRSVRAFGDGVVSVVLAAYLTALGLSDLRIGVVVTATLLGSAALTLGVGLRAHRIARRRLLRLVSLLMIATGLGFAAATEFWPVLVVAFVGTLNPSGGDVSVFLPTEQALLPATAPDTQRTALFARYTLLGTLVAAVGALCAGVPEWLGDRVGVASTTALRWTFVGYAALGLVVLLRYRQLSPMVEPTAEAPSTALGPSRSVVYRLAALFSLDAFGGGFVITALLVLWLQRRFDLSLAVSGAVFFWAGVLSAFSALVAVRIAARIGLVRTMVFTHLPANGFLDPRRVHADGAARRGRPAGSARRCRRWTCRRGTSLRHGCRVAGGATRGGQRHQRAAQPGRRPAGDRRRLDAGPVHVRLAARDRWLHQGDVRPAAAADVPGRAPTRGDGRPRRWRSVRSVAMLDVAPPDEQLVLASGRGRLALAATVAASGMASLDATVVNVALPHIGEDLDAGVGALQWVLTGYLLALASLILLGGALGDRYGRRRVFMIGTVLVRRRLAAVRRRADHRGARRGPDPPGGRRRAADAGQPGDPPGELPARRPLAAPSGRGPA